MIKKRNLAQTTVTSQGTIDLRESPLTYSFKGNFIETGLVIESLNLKYANFSTKLRGELKKETLRLDGFCLLTKPPINLAFFDISSSIKLGLSKIRIENLSSSWEKMPFSLEGDIFISDPLKMNLTLSSGKIKTSAENLSFYFPAEGKLGVYIEQAVSTYSRGSNSFRIPFKDFNILLDFQNGETNFIEFKAKIYDGLLEGEGYVNKATIPFNCALAFKTKNVDANKLHFSSVESSNIYGISESYIRFRSYPRANLNGELIVRKGYLDNVEFFKWLSDFFQMTSLERVDFDKLSASFSVDSQGIDLDRVSLDSKEVNLNGNLKLDQDSLVSGRVSLSLSRKLFESSRRFRSLLKLLPEDSSSLRFDFQLSGLLNSMNIKWLESDFKTNLQDRLPEAAEIGLEKSLEDIMESIAAKNE